MNKISEGDLVRITYPYMSELYPGVYKVVQVVVMNDGVLYRLDGVPGWATPEDILKFGY